MAVNKDEDGIKKRSYTTERRSLIGARTRKGTRKRKGDAFRHSFTCSHIRSVTLINRMMTYPDAICWREGTDHSTNRLDCQNKREPKRSCPGTRAECFRYAESRKGSELNKRSSIEATEPGATGSVRCNDYRASDS